jgi:drug/metabolite transporter (DMT)-like permease
MNTLQITLSIVFALSLALGQTLFKLTADHWQQAQADRGPYLSILSPWLFAAVTSYGATALLWIYILRSTPLAKAYVFSIAGSAIVPVIAYVIFKEPLTAKYWAGFALVLTGIYLCASP